MARVERIRKRLLAACGRHARTARPQGSGDAYDRSGKVVRGIYRAEEIIREFQARPDASEFLKALHASVFQARESFMEEEEGWALGGLRTILDEIEREQARLTKGASWWERLLFGGEKGRK